MTQEQIRVVEETFAMVRPIAQDAGRLFYSNLFAAAPELRALFRSGDPEEQARKLMHVLAVVVGSLRTWEQIAPVVADLGRRHADYGVKPRDYDTVGAALLATLEQGLGDAFTPEARSAWASLYGEVAATMQAAAAVACEAALVP